MTKPEEMVMLQATLAALKSAVEERSARIYEVL